MTLDEAFTLTGDDVTNCATIIVATIQSLRVEETENRKIYADAGGLMEHFAEPSADGIAGLEKEGEEVTHSLANVLKMQRPMVIVDEAHSARSKLSFDSLARVQPVLHCGVYRHATDENDEGKHCQQCAFSSFRRPP